LAALLTTTPRPPHPPLFPYTTLFRSLADTGTTEEPDLSTQHVRGEQVDDLDARLEELRLRLQLIECRGLAVDGPALRDLQLLAQIGKHTSELQSRENLVCRLLLEKKK